MRSPQRKKPQKRRLPEYDYRTSGAYLVTSCTRERQPFFQMNELKEIILNEWHALPQRFPEMTLEIIEVMPDHIHCLFLLNGEMAGCHSVSQIMQAFKSLISNTWRSYVASRGWNGPYRLWQVSFHDHIVRNERDFFEKWRYVTNNPVAKMLKDQQVDDVPE